MRISLSDMPEKMSRHAFIYQETGTYGSPWVGTVTENTKEPYCCLSGNSCGGTPNLDLSDRFSKRTLLLKGDK